MLDITGMNRFYYIMNFTDMRCKYSRVLAVPRHQLGCEPEKGEVFHRNVKRPKAGEAIVVRENVLQSV